MCSIFGISLVIHHQKFLFLVKLSFLREKHYVIFKERCWMKKIGTYLIYLIGLVLLVYYGVNHMGELRITAGREFNPLPPIIFTSIYAIVMGVYLAIPRLLNMLTKVGRVRIDWLKILIIGIPTLFVSISGILLYSITPFGLTSLVQWLYLKFNIMGTDFIGIASGYILASSFTKEENTDTTPTKEFQLAKVLSLIILIGFTLYMSLSTVIHPIKLVTVHADIVETDNQEGYFEENGKSEVFFIQTKINYTFEFKNMLYSEVLQKSPDDQRVRIEPKEKLQSLFQDKVFARPNSYGSGKNGNMTELNVTYTIGSIDPKGKHVDRYPPTSEVLEKVKDSLYDAELVIELGNGKTKRYDLADYQEK